MRLDAMAVEFPAIQGHPNRMPFEGVLTLVDVPSDRAPSGSRGHRVTLSRTAAEAALPSLLGMAVDFRPDWDGHDARSKCGILTSADIVGQRLMVGGYLYARDFPEVEAKLHDLAAGSMGMSYELADAHVEDMRASDLEAESRDFYRSRDSVARKGCVQADVVSLEAQWNASSWSFPGGVFRRGLSRER